MHNILCVKLEISPSKGRDDNPYNMVRIIVPLQKSSM